MSKITDVGMTTVELDGVATAYIEEGNGDPVLLLHGSGPGVDGPMSFSGLTPFLTDRWRTFIIDMPGYGRSAMLRDADTPANCALHVLRFMDLLGIDRATVVGHSRGGRIATELALAAPDRTVKLVVLASGSIAPRGHLDDHGNFTQPALDLVWFGADSDTSYATFRRALHTQVVRPEHLPDDVLRAAYDHFMSSGMVDQYVSRMKAFDPLAHYHTEDPDEFVGRLRTLATPMCLIWGVHDDTSPFRRAVDLLDIIPDMELHIFPRASHFVQRDRPAAVAQTVAQFLSSSS